MPAVAEIPDLWGNDIKLDVVSPLAILRTQGELLGQKTGGLLLGRINSTVLGEQEDTKEVVHQFEIFAPAVNYTEHMFDIRHKLKRPYPVTITLPEPIDWPKELFPSYPEYSPSLAAVAAKLKPATVVAASRCECRDGDMFTRALGVVLKSSALRSLIDSLLVMSNERNTAPTPAA